MSRVHVFTLAIATLVGTAFAQAATFEIDPVVHEGAGDLGVEVVDQR